MSTYRDDLEAALARNRDLELRIRELERQAEPTVAPPPPAGGTQPHPVVAPDAIAALVAADEAARQRRIDARESTRARERRLAIARLRRRPLRVTVTRPPGATRISIARTSLADGLHAHAGGIAFAAINPGVFIMLAIGGVLAAMGMSAAVVVTGAIVGWLALLAAISVVYTRLVHPTWHLDITRAGHFALHTGDPQRPRQLGRVSELELSVPREDPAELAHICFEHRSGADLRIGYLTDRDLGVVRAVPALQRAIER